MANSRQAENERARRQLKIELPPELKLQIKKEAYALDVRAKLRRLGFDGAVLDDLQQDVFVVALRRCDDIPEEERAWLLGVARKLAGNYRARRYHVNELPRAEAGAEAPGDGGGAELCERLRRGLEELDAVDRELVMRCAVHGGNVADVAGALGMPWRGAYARLKAARERLRWSIWPLD